MSRFNREHHEEETKVASSWGRSPQAECLRVEVSEREFWILPYAHFVSAKYQAGSDQEEIRIKFSAYSLTIRGLNLKELALGFQKCSVEWVRTIPSRYTTVPASDTPIVQSLEVIGENREDTEST
jgi:hypothetical protein